MSDADHAAYIFRVLGSGRGDDLERARMAFGNKSAKQLAEQYGQSGQTCQEILDGYVKHRRRHDAAVEWLKGRLPAG